MFGNITCSPFISQLHIMTNTISLYLEYFVTLEDYGKSWRYREIQDAWLMETAWLVIYVWVLISPSFHPSCSFPSFSCFNNRILSFPIRSAFITSLINRWMDTTALQEDEEVGKMEENIYNGTKQNKNGWRAWLTGWV